jgi:AcrR family transcriptional regulator
MTATTASPPTQPTKGPNRRTAQRDATRAALFAETVEEFKRVGFAQTEIASITDRVGVSRGTFYVHFAGKEQVLRELLIVEERRIAAAARRISDHGAPLDEVLEAVVDAVLRAERRLGRPLVRDLCAGQFIPGATQGHVPADHAVGLLLVEVIAERVPQIDPVDLAMTFLTGLFGLLAIDESPNAERRRRLALLVRLATLGAVPA